jgi:hypothetical protein
LPASCWWRLRLECRWLSVVGGFELGGWDVAEDAVQPAVVVPVDPFHRRVLDVIDRLRRVRPERTALADHLGLEQADSRLGQRIIIGVTDATDRRRNPLQDKGSANAVARLARLVRSTFLHAGWLLVCRVSDDVAISAPSPGKSSRSTVDAIGSVAMISRVRWTARTSASTSSRSVRRELAAASTAAGDVVGEGSVVRLAGAARIHAPCRRAWLILRSRLG